MLEVCMRTMTILVLQLKLAQRRFWDNLGIIHIYTYSFWLKRQAFLFFSFFFSFFLIFPLNSLKKLSFLFYTFWFVVVVVAFSRQGFSV
jgi:hypothetical protein